MPAFDDAAALSGVLEQDQDRVVRLWRRRLAVELHEVELTREGLRQPLRGLVMELARLLRTRGGEALRLWPESARGHGLRRYEERFDADDVAREFKALQQVLLQAYARRCGQLEPEVAELVAELCGEAAAPRRRSWPSSPGRTSAGRAGRRSRRWTRSSASPGTWRRWTSS